MTFKNQVILVIVFIFIIFIVSLFIYRTPSQNQTILPSPTQKPSFENITPGATTPLISITESPADAQRTKQEIIQRMPVTFQEFTIEYLVTSDTFMVTILKSPFEDNKKKAEQWFHENGIVDLTSITINYIKPRFVQ